MGVSKVFSNIAHAFAWFGKKVVSAAKSGDAIAAEAAHYAPEIEAITKLVSPKAAEVEDVAFHALGSLAAAVHAAGDAAGANGMSVSLDAELIAKIKNFIALVKDPVVAAPVAK